MSRLARRKDANQNEIVLGLKKLNFFTWDTSRLGFGFPDLIVFTSEKVFFFEIKMPGETLTPAEETFHELCPYPVHIVTSLFQATNIIMKEGEQNVRPTD